MAKFCEYEGVTDREFIFCREYVRTYNATKSAIKAGYSEKSARQTGCTLLTKPNIIACVRDMQENLARTMEESAEKIVSEILELARGEGVEVRDRVKAFELASKLLGHDKATKIEAKIQQDVNVSGGFSFTISNETSTAIAKLTEKKEEDED